MKMKLSDRIIFPVLIVQLGSLYGPIGYLLNLPNSRMISAALTVCALLYLVRNAKSFLALFHVAILRDWLVFIWFAPLAFMSIQFLAGYIDADDFLYWTIFVSSVGSLFSVTLIFSKRQTTKTIRLLYLAAVAAALSGFILNYIDYSFVRSVLVFISSSVGPELRVSRMLGFFPHPNEAAIAVVMYAVVLVLVAPPIRYRNQFRVAVTGVMFVCVLMTGSRTSLILGALLVSATAYHLVRAPRNTEVLRERVFQLALYAALAGLVAISVVALAVELDSTAIARSLERLTTSIDILTGNSSAIDTSSDIRVNVLGPYLELAASRPMIGYGPQATMGLVARGYFVAVSQNSWVQWAVEYGFLYSGFGAVLFVRTFRFAQQDMFGQMSDPKAADALIILLVLLTVASISLVDIFYIKSVVMTFSVFLGIRHPVSQHSVDLVSRRRFGRRSRVGSMRESSFTRGLRRGR